MIPKSVIFFKRKLFEKKITISSCVMKQVVKRSFKKNISFGIGIKDFKMSTLFVRNPDTFFIFQTLYEYF